MLLNGLAERKIRIDIVGVSPFRLTSGATVSARKHSRWPRHARADVAHGLAPVQGRCLRCPIISDP